MRSILTYVPSGVRLRPLQEELLLSLEEKWDRAPIHVVDAPVGLGKSLVAYVIMAWQAAKRKTCLTIVPENSLVDQYAESFPRLPILHRKDSYICTRSVEGKSCSRVKQEAKRTCGDCHYVKALRRARAAPTGCMNFHLHMAHRLHRDVLLADEAHRLLSYTRDLATRRIWKHVAKYPNWVRSYADLLKWTTQADTSFTPEVGAVLHQEEPSHLVKRAFDSYRGEDRECLKLIPLDVSSDSATDFLRNQSKLVLLSATIGDEDLQDLGLLGRGYVRHSVPSAIPPDRRPVHFYPLLSVSRQSLTRSIPDVADAVRCLLREHDGAGMIHAPYSMMRLIRPLLEDEPRLRWHSSANKRDAVRDFRQEAGNGAVLMSSGLYEGIDLAGPDFTWQAILKVPWPSLADPALRWRLERRPKAYAWEAARLMLQACGRICRGPDDYGKTYILDRSFKRLMKENSGFFPPWWMEAYEEFEVN